MLGAKGNSTLSHGTARFGVGLTILRLPQNWQPPEAKSWRISNVRQATRYPAVLEPNTSGEEPVLDGASIPPAAQPQVLVGGSDWKQVTPAT